MFVALEAFEPREAGIFGGILNILTRPKARIEARKAWDATFGVVVVAKPVSASDWRRITDLADLYADRMLLPDGLNAPPPIQEPRFPRFERRLLLGTALEIVKRTRMPMYRRIVGLVDSNGKYSDFLFPLLHHYTAVKVLTRQVPEYLVQAKHMMEELGAPVIVCEDYGALADCVLIIAPDGISTSEKLACPVLTTKPPETLQNSDFITDLQVVPPPEIASLCPYGIEPHKFIAALYEYCGVETITDVANRMTFRYSHTDLSRVVLNVMQASETLSIF